MFDKSKDKVSRKEFEQLQRENEALRQQIALLIKSCNLAKTPR